MNLTEGEILLMLVRTFLAHSIIKTPLQGWMIIHGNMIENPYTEHRLIPIYTQLLHHLIIVKFTYRLLYFVVCTWFSLIPEKRTRGRIDLSILEFNLIYYLPFLTLYPLLYTSTRRRNTSLGDIIRLFAKYRCLYVYVYLKASLTFSAPCISCVR